MNIIKSITALFSLTLLITTASSSFAVPTYTYTAPITWWANSWGSANWASYAALDGSNIKFEFTTAAPLTDFGCSHSYSCQNNLSSQVLSWRYHGGSSFLNIGSDIAGSVLSGLFLNVDSNGNIINDRFYVSGPVVIPTLENEVSILIQAHDGYDQQLMQSSYLRQYSTGIYSQPLYASLSEGMSNMHGAGSWAFADVQNSAASNLPEPSGLVLIGLGLLGLIASRRRLGMFV
jgi:hypothetical protein